MPRRNGTRGETFFRVCVCVDVRVCQYINEVGMRRRCVRKKKHTNWPNSAPTTRPSRQTGRKKEGTKREL